MKKIGIGFSDFKKIIEEDYYFVDKSLLIKEIIQDGSAVILLPRPRRFGKTLNMSMLKCFFDIREDNKRLFDDLLVSKELEVMEHINKYPVIYITLADVKCNSYEKFLVRMREIIAQIYKEYNYIFEKIALTVGETNTINSIKANNATEVEMTSSIKNLSRYLNEYYNKKAIVIMDEYDTPINESYTNGYYNEMIQFMRAFLTPIFKDNLYLEKGIMTGILRISKESIFSGLNNLDVCGIAGEHFSTHFGFTNNELDKILKEYGKEENKQAVKDWYNGYIFGNTEMYNPWSILNYIHKNELAPYWINTANNGLIVELIKKYQFQIREKLEALIEGDAIEVELNESIVFSDIDKVQEVLWNFLYNTGYLKCIKKEMRNNRIYGRLQIPNIEVKLIIEDSIMLMLKTSVTNRITDLLNCLIEGKIREFEYLLQETVVNMMSYHDVGKDIAEISYHSFVLGLVAHLIGDYEIKSNRESGFGRYDIAIIPKDKEKLGFVIEFKMVKKGVTREETIEFAKKQVIENRYNQELKETGVKNIKQLVIVFEKKDVTVEEI